MQEELKVGLALGSGAFRGLSQIGILEVFEENHIPIHMVSGCSIGAVVGSIYCAGRGLKICEGPCLHAGREAAGRRDAAKGGSHQGRED